MNETAAKLAVDGLVSFFKKEGGLPLYTKILLGIAAFAAVAYLSYAAYRKNKALAKASHERDLAIEKLNQKKLEWELAPVDEEISKKLEELSRLKEEAARLDEIYLELKEKHEYERYRIGAIKNWEDMDRYLASLGTGNSVG